MGCDGLNIIPTLNKNEFDFFSYTHIPHGISPMFDKLDVGEEFTYQMYNIHP